MLSTEELNKLGREKQEIIKSFDRMEMTDEMFKEKIASIEKRVNDITSAFVNNVLNKNMEVENKMADKVVVEDAKVPKEKKPKVESVKKPKETSLASFVSRALQMKSVKNKEDAVAKMCEWVPTLDKAKAAQRVNAIIGAVKKQQGKWVGYSWDEASYQLTPKQ